MQSRRFTINLGISPLGPEDIVVRTHARSLAHRIGKFIAIQPIPCYLALACDYLSSGFR